MNKWLEKSWPWIKRGFRHFFTYLPPFVGLYVFVMISFFDWFANMDALREFLQTISIVLMTGGLLTGLLMALRFFDFFRNQLENILLGDNFLPRRSDLRSLWSKVSRALYEKRFPEISDELEKIICDKYFPKGHGYFSERFDVDIRIVLLEGEYIELIEIINQTIKSHSTDQISIPFGTSINWIPDDDKTSINCGFIEVNDKVLVSGVEENIKEYSEDKTLSIKLDWIRDDPEELKVNGKLTVFGSREYNITRKFIKRYSLYKNPLKSFVANHIYKEMSVNLSYPNEMSIEFKGSGVIDDFKKIEVPEPNGNCRWKYSHVLLPRQGFVIGMAVKC